MDFEVTLDELKRKIDRKERFVLVESQSPMMFEDAHLPGAVHFLQIWTVPDTRGLPPGYEQKSIPEETRRGRLVLLASRDGRDGSVGLHQDVALLGARLAPRQTVVHTLGTGRQAWVHLGRGAGTLNGRPM